MTSATFLPDPRIGAYLFDMDGTLVETERFWAIGICDLLRDDGLDLPFEESYRIVCGHSWNAIHKDIIARFPSEGAYSNDEQADRLKPYYLRAREGADLRIPGSAEAFLALARHTPCAIVSGSRREDVEENADLLGIRDAIALIVGAQDCPVGKPAPDGYLMASHGLGVEPSRCVVFEDSHAGVLSGLAAGMRVVALDRDGRDIQRVRGLAHLCLPALTAFSPALLP